MRYLIVTGQSGAGKTACVHYLEDQGSFCMDNMPPMLLPKLIDAFNSTPMRQTSVTIAMDVRSGEFFDAYAVAGMISELRKLGNLKRCSTGTRRPDGSIRLLRRA